MDLVEGRAEGLVAGHLALLDPRDQAGALVSR